MIDIMRAETKRIEWIDALRGLTMILVVFGHVEHYGYGYMGDESVLRNFFSTFRMPLFFFISGFIAFRGQLDWNWGRTHAAILKKLRVQLIPTLVFGLSFSITVYASQRGYSNPLRGIASFVVDGAKNGYWFTISLLEMFIVHYMICHWTYKCLSKGKKDCSVTVMVVVSVVFYALSLRFSNEQIIRDGQLIDGTENYFQLALNVLCIPRSLKYYQYFVFGYMAAQNKEKLFKLIESRYFIAIALLLWLLSFVLANKVIDKVTVTLLSLVAAYSGLVVLFAFFYIYKDTFGSDRRLGHWLQYVGKRTLDIYLLHFFFLPTLPMIGVWLVQHPNVTLEFFATTSISLMIITLCLIFSSLIRTSAFLEHYLFGVKNSKYPI